MFQQRGFKNIALIIVIIAVFVGIGVYFISNKQDPSFTPTQYSNNQQISTVSEQKESKLLRPGLIAFTLKDENGKLQIFTINPDGAGKKQLTFERENGRPDWSPDGKKIVFMSIRNGTTPTIWVMNSEGTDQKFLSEGLTPDWSPDGGRIAYTSSDAQIWLMDADGSNKRQITKSNTFKAGPSWSPNGKEMVFILVKNPGSPSHPQPEIGIMNSDGTNERVLTIKDRINVKVNQDGSATTLETAYDANAPSWSPVENKIAFWSGIETQYGQIWTINSDGTGSKQLTEDPSHRNSDDPSWSPDGKKMLFNTGRSGRNELWVMDADGENERRISDVDAVPFPGRASWQPVYEYLPPNRAKTLISPGIAHPKNAAEGLKRFTGQMDILTENGMNLFGFAANWKDLELSPYEFDLQANPINPLTLLIPKYPQVKGVVFVLKMIDTNWKPMPKDLETKSFDDPEVLKRFDALIDAIAAEPSSKRITHILLGNELDGYLGRHPEETEAFEIFYNRALLRIHEKLPGVKVGTIFTAGGVLGNVNIFNFFNRINKFSDFIDYTYYPVSDLVRGNVSVDWQMRPISETAEHLHFMAKHAGNKPFAFTEIGYSSSPINNSSEEKQADFVKEMFRVLSPYQKNGQIDFILYSFMYDAPPNFTEPYAKEQGIEASKEFHAFMDNLGLRSYETGKPRKAWNAFVEGVKEWNK